MSHSLRDIEPSGSGIALFVCMCVFHLSTVNVDACRWIWFQAFRGRCERRWGSPTWGRPWRPHPAVCANHLDRGPQVYVCASFTSIMQTVFAQPRAANEQRLDCWLYGVKCQLSVVHIILTGTILLHYFSHFSVCLCEGAYILSTWQFSSTGAVRKTHRSFPLLLLCRWHARHLVQLFLFLLMWWIASTYWYFSDALLPSTEDKHPCPLLNFCPLYVS